MRILHLGKGWKHDTKVGDPMLAHLRLHALILPNRQKLLPTVCAHPSGPENLWLMPRHVPLRARSSGLEVGCICGIDDPFISDRQPRRPHPNSWSKLVDLVAKHQTSIPTLPRSTIWVDPFCVLSPRGSLIRRVAQPCRTFRSRFCSTDRAKGLSI